MTPPKSPSTGAIAAYFALAGLIMGYAWGYRGSVGHEAGAMVGGALLGMALALGSGRLDWHRRSLVVGLLGAVGWAWGGSLSYMEQTFYTISDSFPDVFYGYAMLFLLGGLWAGIGGGVLGLAFTETRSDLERLARPFTAICAVFFLVYVYFFFMREQREALETFTVRHFHDGDWLSASITLLVGGVYWLVRPKDRSGSALFIWGALAWWIGYLLLTKFGGLRLGPLHRSESWGGILGVLVLLILYLVRRRNRAGLMLCLYGILGGGLGFVLAVFIRHPIMVQWGPFENLPRMPQWKTAEVSFGIFMGLAMAFGVLRFIRGGLQPPKEDAPRSPLDVYAAFVVLVALTWINFRRHAVRWLTLSNESGGGNMWLWYVLFGALSTAPLLYMMDRYRRGDRSLAPQSAFGKGVGATLLLVWLTLMGCTFDQVPNIHSIVHHLLMWTPAALSSLLLVGFSSSARQAGIPSSATADPSDPKWRVGAGYWTLFISMPIVFAAVSGISMAMQDGPYPVGRKRFGQDAYWRQTSQLLGEWRSVAVAESLSEAGEEEAEIPVESLVFGPYRDVVARMTSGEAGDAHRWFLKNQYTWLHWYGKVDDHPQRAEVPLHFREGRLYISWPPHQPDLGFVVFERTED